MRGIHLSRRHTGVATAVIGLVLAGCSARESETANTTGTLNLGSLPAAEAWVDGKPAGTTPLAVSLPAGRHELVLKQVGFTERRESLVVEAGAVGAFEATLDPISADDLDAVRQIAASLGVTVDPYQAPEMHRGGSFDGGVSLLFPRNDVRREGLVAFRVDVTAAYDGKGWLEFRKGKTSLYRSRFTPETLVTNGRIPAEVASVLRTGDTVTWGIWFDDGRKPVTAQFEVVNKPAATKKLTELASDKRLLRLPATVRAQLEADVLQNYRLYSEALARLLVNRSLEKDGTLSYQGIVSCLRRLDLEDTALFAEAAALSVGKGVGLRAGGEIASVAAPRLTATPGRVTPPVAPRATPLRPAPGAPTGSATPPPPTPPAGDTDGTTPPPTMPPAARDPLRPDPVAQAQHEASELAERADLANAAATTAAQAATNAQNAATAANDAANAARLALQGSPDDPAARAAVEAAEQAAAQANQQANQAALDAQSAAAAAARAADQAQQAEARARRMAAAVPPSLRPTPTPVPPVNPVKPPVVPPVVPPAPPAPPANEQAINTAREALDSARLANDAAHAAFVQAQMAAQDSPDDPALRLAADAAREAANLSDQRMAAASAALEALLTPPAPR